MIIGRVFWSSHFGTDSFLWQSSQSIVQAFEIGLFSSVNRFGKKWSSFSLQVFESISFGCRACRGIGLSKFRFRLFGILVSHAFCQLPKIKLCVKISFSWRQYLFVAIESSSSTAPNTACTRRVGVAAFSGSFFGLRLVPSKRRSLVPPTSG